MVCQVSRFGQRLRHLAQTASEQPEVLVGEAAWMPWSEAELVLERWNSTAAPCCSGGRGGGSVPGLFETVAMAGETAVAVVFEGEVVSYGGLERRTALLASRVLSASGGSTAEVVGLCVEKSVEEVAGMVGIMRAGRAYVPLDPRLPLERLGYLAGQCGCGAVVAQRRFEELVQGLESSSGVMLVVIAESADTASKTAGG